MFLASKHYKKTVINSVLGLSLTSANLFITLKNINLLKFKSFLLVF